MTVENILPISLGLWLLYIVLRFIIFEVLTVILRRVTPVRNWLRRQNERGRLLQDIRSSALFAPVLRGFGDGLEWIVGRGWFRGPTFVFIAAITIFLASLPVDRAADARASYDSARKAVFDFKPDSANAQAACVVENGLDVVRARTGVVAAAPFRVYPFDEHIRERFATADPDRAVFLFGALVNGRVLTDDAGATPPPPQFARLWAANTRDGRLINKGYYLLPKSPESEAAAADLRNLCDDDSATRSVMLRPIRDPADYVGLLTRGRIRILAFLDDPEIHRAYDTLQVHLAVSQLGLSFFVALGAAAVLWIAVKLAVVISRTPRKGLWLVLNYSLVAGLSTLAAVIVAETLWLSRGATNSVAPLTIAYVLASAPGEGAEAMYRAHANTVVERGLRAIKPTCAELGARSPLSGTCELVDAMAEPWNPQTRSFDFARLLPVTAGAQGKTEGALMQTLSNSMLTFGIIAAGVDKDEQDDFAFSLWKGVHLSSLLIVVLAPLFLVVLVATLLAPLLELRWTIVKRVSRIVR